MNNLLRVAFRAGSSRSLINPLRNAMSLRTANQIQLTRSLWSISNVRDSDRRLGPLLCSCGCMQKMGAHSKAERELVEFLTEEILAERKAQKSETLPTEIDGFKANLNGAEVTLTKQIGDETIKITFNVNDSVDTDVEPEMHPNMDKPELGGLKSKPAFKVELKRGDTTISLLCSFAEPNEQDDGYSDVIELDEISIFDGKQTDNTYAVSGDVIDSYLYDLILNYLEEKGISNEFVEKLSNYSTSYEHSAYIGLLEGLSKYASGK